MQGNDKHWILYNGSSEEGQGGYGQEDVVIHTANIVVTVLFLNQRGRETHRSSLYVLMLLLCVLNIQS